MYEINLVPDVKIKMLKTLRLRNIIFFICIVTVAVAGGVTAVLGSVAGGQAIARASKDSKIEDLSTQLLGYENISEFLTIQDQLGKIAEINENKQLLSRVFNVLDAFRPQGNDKVEISELAINMSTLKLNFEAQADAGDDPLIDYRVLEAYKKGIALTKYDYGRYVDAEGNEIPTRCIKETNDEGEVLNDNGSIYAEWYKYKKGCDPTVEEDEEEEDEDEASLITPTIDFEETTTEEETEEEEEGPDENETVRIWRTPQFKDWYAKEYMDLDGSISGVEHFESECINYTGTEGAKNVKWTAENDCLVAEDEVEIKDSSNGRDASGNLVLRFSASVTINKEVFSFANKHMMAISPTGQNVTDSYRQIEGLFAQRAEDCDEDDSACVNDTTNSTGEGA